MFHSMYILRLSNQSLIFRHLFLDFSGFLPFCPYKLWPNKHFSYTLLYSNSWVHTKYQLLEQTHLSYLRLGNKLFHKLVAIHNIHSSYLLFLMVSLGQIFKQGTMGMACVCTMMSKASAPRPEVKRSNVSDGCG